MKSETLNELGQLVVAIELVAENGGRRKITKRQAIITQLVNRAAKADWRAIKILLDLVQEIGSSDEKLIEQLRARLRRSERLMTENLTLAEYDTLLRQDFCSFAARCFHDLNPQAKLAINWHLEVIAAHLRRAARCLRDLEPIVQAS